MRTNDFGFDMKMKAASSVEKYIYEALKEGKFNLTPGSELSVWRPMSCERVYSYYKTWVEYEGLKGEVSSEFSKRLKRILSERYLPSSPSQPALLVELHQSKPEITDQQKFLSCDRKISPFT